MSGGWHRRAVLGGGGASLLALGLAGRSSAALPGGDELRRQLAAKLPPQVLSLVPGEAFEAADFVQQLLALERQAGRLRLPKSLLSLGEGDIPLDPDQLYELALPRLVALIDRAEWRNRSFADQAGGLLAKLHATQHVVPEALRSAPAPLQPLGFGPEDQISAELKLPPISTPVVQPLPSEAAPEPDKEPDAELDPEAPRTISRSLRFADLADEYAAFFASAVLKPAHRQTAEWHVTMMRESRKRYAAAGKRARVPWYFIGAVHGLEASFNFRAHFHNGDFPLHRRTRQVPAGRPLVWLPPSDWESSTIDALRLMGFSGQQDWSLPRTLYRLEAFNGFGYRRIGRASPYLWSFSNHFERGKFVADGHFDPRARSQQCGAAMMLKLLEQAGELDAA